MSKQYEKETLFINLGAIYIKDGKKFATIKIGNKSLICNLTDSNKRFDNIVAAGKMDQSEASEKVEQGASKGRKYEIQLVVEQ